MGFDGELSLDVATGQQFAIGVGQIHLHREGGARSRHVAAMAGHLCLKRRGRRRKDDAGQGAGFDEARLLLRHRYPVAQHREVANRHGRPGGGGAAGRDVGPDVGMPGSDDAVEGRGDFGVAEQHLGPLQTGGGDALATRRLVDGLRQHQAGSLDASGLQACQIGVGHFEFGDGFDAVGHQLGHLEGGDVLAGHDGIAGIDADGL